MREINKLVKELYDKAIYYEGSSPSGLLCRAGDMILELEQELKKKRAKRLSREQLERIVHKALDIDNLLKEKELRASFPKMILAIIESKYEIIDAIIEAQGNKEESER